MRIYGMMTAILGLSLGGMAGAHAQQSYPTKPIRLIVPFPGGGQTDVVARILAQRLAEVFGQSVVVDNRPGAAGSIGVEIALRAPADGYTLVQVSTSYAANVALYKLAYDPVNDIVPIIMIGEIGNMVTIHPSGPFKSVKELIAYARGNPGKISYGTVGVGSVTHLLHELLNLEAKISTVHIPFKGAGPAIIGIISNEAHIGSLSAVPVTPHLKAGRLRAIGITTAQRSPSLPDVPSIGETVPGFDVPHWYAIWGPRGLPKDIVALWNREVSSMLRTEEMSKQMRAEGMEPAGGPPEQFLNVLKPTVERWRRVVKEANIQG